MIGITESPEGVALALVQFIVQRAASSTDHRLCRVALSGGSTPRRLYEMLARPPWRDQVDWARIEVFWSDERCVPPDDPASNYRMAREALLEQVPIHPAHIHRILGSVYNQAEPS